MKRSARLRQASGFVTPAVALLAFVTLYPLLFSLWISFRDWTLLAPERSRFIGLANYLEVFSSKTAVYSFLRSVYFAALSISGELVLGLAVALILNQSFRGRGLLRALLILPWALPDVVNSVLWKWVLNGDFGALNGILYQLGLIREYKYWLSSGTGALHLLIATNIWRCTPFVAIVLLAGLQSIPEELYEGAQIDGAGFFQRLRFITLPMLKSTILVVLVLRSMDALRVFGLIYIVTKGGPGDSTKTIGYYIFETAFQGLRLGFAASLSWILFLIVMVLAIVYFRTLKRE
jgi:multiple sugar transport system permease protein